MKTVFLLLILAFSSVIYSQDYENEVPYTFEQGEEYYLLADSVNVRKTPQLKGELVTVLPLGTKVKILSKSSTVTTLNNYKMNWYEIRFDGNKKGFVWGGKIAKTSFRSTKNPDLVFHFGLDMVKVENEFEESYYQIRIEQKGKQISKTTIKGFGQALKNHELTNLGNKGLTNVDDVIYLEGFSEACGDNGGSVVLMHTAGKLSEIKRLGNFADVPVFSHDIFYFPSDMKGRKDRIVFYHEVGEWKEGEFEDDEGYIELSEQKTIIYKWDGSKLTETAN